MKRLLIIFMLLLPAVTHAQKDRTISDLLYFPFSCISDPMTTKDQAWQAVIDTFGYCESVNLSPIVVSPSPFVIMTGTTEEPGMISSLKRRARQINFMAIS